MMIRNGNISQLHYLVSLSVELQYILIIHDFNITRQSHVYSIVNAYIRWISHVRHVTTKTDEFHSNNLYEYISGLFIIGKI